MSFITSRDRARAMRFLGARDTFLVRGSANSIDYISRFSRNTVISTLCTSTFFLVKFISLRMYQLDSYKLF